MKTVVIVSNGVTPYGVHFLRRVADEIRDLQLRTIYSYEYSMGHWSIELPHSINASVLGVGEEALGQGGAKAIFRALRRGREIVRAIRESDPVAVMVLGYGNISHALAIEWCWWAGVPCLMWGDSNIRGDVHRGIKAAVKKVIVRRVVSRCAAILACGHLGAEYFKKYGARTEQIFFVPNEPDYAAIENVPQALVMQVAADYGLSRTRRRLIFSGRMVAAKRVDLLVHAFISIAEERPDWDLLLVGSGHLASELEGVVPGRLQKRIVWTGFVDSSERVAALYRLSDVLVLPSDYEPWALVINEAACAGLAIICTEQVGAAAELVREGENGRIIRASDMNELRDAILDATDEDNLPRYKQRSRDILMQWRQNADPVEGFRCALAYALGNDVGVS